LHIELSRRCGIEIELQPCCAVEVTSQQSPDHHPPDSAGLGLTIVHQVPRAHGGHVKLRSTPRRGSTFTIALSQPA
jgi:signal transduction histidine kinase